MHHHNFPAISRNSSAIYCDWIGWSMMAPPPSPGACFNFHSGRGGEPPPWTPSPPPLDPLPPSPLSSSAPENLGFGNFFYSWGKNFRRLRRMPYTVYVLLHVCSIYLVLQTTMPQRSLSMYFSSPVQPSPCAKREDVIDALLYFRFKDRTTSRERQEAYNEAQKACATLFLSVPMATLCDFVAVAQKMATRDRSSSTTHGGSSSGKFNSD